jgi:hypothetical protein
LWKMINQWTSHGGRTKRRTKGRTSLEAETWKKLWQKLKDGF